MISRLKSLVKYFLRLPSQIYYRIAGSREECNVCGHLTNEFLSNVWMKNVVCPVCYSDIRHRLFMAILDHKPGYDQETLLRDKAVLHFAPEQGFKRKFRKLSSNYLTADYFAETYENLKGIDLKMSMTDMNIINDGSFDTMIAIDVLEHIPDDKKAIQEIHRILKQGGTCILSVPQKDNLEVTDEDITLTDPKERERRFGQFDHFRIYGNDFRNKLEKEGFEVKIFSAKDFDEAMVKRFVLAPEVPSPHPLSTNFRRIYFGKKV